MGLADAGCTEDLVELYGAFEETGDVDACKSIQQKHRCELVCALHEAQRPIDVCDWLIRNLEREQ